VIGLLKYAHALAAGTPAEREQAVRVARRQVRQRPSAQGDARLAIALGTPAQRLYTPSGAARYARRAVHADDARWSPAARQYLIDTIRLYQQLARHLATDNPASTQKIARVKDQRIVQLKAQLADARRKLQALAHVEDRLDSSSP
jgi:hypothetical protein